jgi:3-hydroxy-9,10-secoandrosta-1,3,5(10)-triene-9,17-dione monooxygenase
MLDSEILDHMALRQELIGRARDMFPVLRERAPEAERNRRVPDETQQAFVEAGFYRIFQPRRYGGYEMDFQVMLDICSELGRGCGSSSWVYSNVTGQSWINGMKDEQAQDDVWADNSDALIASAFPGKGASVKAVDGGWVADGQWSFSSGIDFVDWVNLQLFVKQEAGPPQHFFAIVPRSDYEIVDDWFANGLAATGSRSLRVKDVFIPAYRGIGAGQVAGGPTPGSAVNSSPIYKLPLFAIGNKQFAATALGIALGGLEAIEADLAARVSVGGAKLADQPTVQVRVAEAGAEIEAARLLNVSDFEESMAVAASDISPSQEQRARWRRNSAYAGKLCVQALDRLAPLAGGRGLGFASSFQRALRDIRAATSQNSMVWDTQAIFYGGQRLGAVLDDPRLFPDKK